MTLISVHCVVCMQKSRYVLTNKEDKQYINMGFEYYSYHPYSRTYAYIDIQNGIVFESYITSTLSKLKHIQTVAILFISLCTDIDIDIQIPLAQLVKCLPMACEIGGSIPDQVISKTQKMVLHTSFSTIRYIPRVKSSNVYIFLNK